MIMDSIFRNYTRAGKKCMRMKYDTSLDPRIFSHAYGQQRKSIKFVVVLVFAGAMLTSHSKGNKMTHTKSTRDVKVQRLVIFVLFLFIVSLMLWKCFKICLLIYAHFTSITVLIFTILSC